MLPRVLLVHPPSSFIRHFYHTSLPSSLKCPSPYNTRQERMRNLILICMLGLSSAFAPPIVGTTTRSSRIFMAEGDAADDEKKFAPLVTGEQLEMMLQEWDTPLVVDAYATWCGPCLLMAPEFEAAAKDMEGKVRFVKLDTDKEEQMAARLNIQGLPTLLFLDKFTPDEGAEDDLGEAKAVLKGRIEGALRKDNIKDLCEHYFFDGPAPEIF